MISIRLARSSISSRGTGRSSLAQRRSAVRREESHQTTRLISSRSNPVSLKRPKPQSHNRSQSSHNQRPPIPDYSLTRRSPSTTPRSSPSSLASPRHSLRSVHRASSSPRQRGYSRGSAGIRTASYSMSRGNRGLKAFWRGCGAQQGGSSPRMRMKPPRKLILRNRSGIGNNKRRNQLLVRRHHSLSYTRSRSHCHSQIHSALSSFTSAIPTRNTLGSSGQSGSS